MRSTVSLRFVAVVSLASLALAGQHANTGSSRNYCSYDWNYVTCDDYVAGRPVAVNARWYLGVTATSI